MNNDLYGIDSGYDLNKDKHCDIEGWFVDKNGHHRPVLKELAKNRIPFGSELYKESEITNCFNISGDYYGRSLNSLYVYSINDDNDELSSPTLNKMLRGLMHPTYSAIKRIMEIDSLIKLSKTKQELTVFRGLKISAKNAFFLNKILKLKSEIFIKKMAMLQLHTL